MASFVRAGSVVGLVLLTAAPVPAATQKEIDAAIQKGTDFLKARYKDARPGVGIGVDPAGHGSGPIALSGIALIEAKTPANDPALRAIAASVRDAAYRETKTYSVALCLIFLDRLEDPADGPLIQLLAVRLLAGQTALGGWGYDCVDSVSQEHEQRLRAGLKNNQLVAGGGPNPPAVNPVLPPKEPKGAAPGKPAAAGKLHPEVEKYAAALWANRVVNHGDDNSNTQFGLLAVWVARKHGVPVEAALDLVEKRFLGSQDPQTGGWGYSGVGGMVMMSSPSMTCAGLLGLSTGVARREERRMNLETAPKEKEPAPKDPKANDPFFNPPTRTDKPAGKKPGDAKRPPDARDLAVQAGMANLGAVLNGHTQAGGLLGNGGRMGERDLYFLWSLERVGVIFGVDKIGAVDWYAHGADAIVRSQTQDGSWNGASYGVEPCTAFAILFLTKANVARDLSSKVQKDTGNTELRAGTGPGATEPAPKPNQPAATVAPGGSSGLPARPLPTPVEDGSAKLAAGLVKVPAADWSKALDQMRDGKGPDYTKGLVQAIHQLDGDRKKQARESLAERLTRMTAESLRGMVKSDDPELRRGAVLACAMKDDKTHVPDLIDRLADDEEIVVRAARAGLKSLTSQDFGPAAGATKDQRKAAADAWRAWWAKQK
ncbi:MAG: hypothetical protein JWO38_1735 [Gemmataceae bacterium]|nr:hypothetical protein [Gemmataceae bacterium]